MNKLGKATFKSQEAFDKYIDFYKTNYKIDNQYKLTKRIKDTMSRVKLYDNDNTLFQTIHKIIDTFMHTFFDSDHYVTKFIESITFTNNYISTMGGSYELIGEVEDLAVIKYGENLYIVIDSDEYIDKEYTPDIEGLSLSEYKRISLIGNEDTPLALAIPGEDISILSVKEETQDVTSEIDKIMKRMKEISSGQAPEFLAIQKQIEELQAKMDKEKRTLMSQIEEQKAIMEAKLAELKKKLTILQDSIYTIQCYLGETIELFQLRTGKHSEIDRPIIISQKLKYLDEDLAQLFSIYGDDVDGGGYTIFEGLLKYNDVALDFFAPYDKCISFFKVSKDGKAYGNGSDEQVNMLKSYNVLHGQKVGFLVRDGENLFIGYTDEERIHVAEDVFLKAGVTYDTPVNDNDFRGERPLGQSSYMEMASRMFIFSILQGLLERKEVTRLPEKVNIFSSFINCKYIQWNYAEGWLKDNRFGNLADLTRKLNRKCMVGDDIILILNLSETSWKRYESERGRTDSYVNRTHDCHVNEGLNKINFIDDKGSLYVSAKKRESWKGATANFLIERQEFINLTYMNSEWLKYFLINKEIGDFKTNYSYVAKYLKIALEFIQKRELTEKLLISKYYPNIDKVHEWIVILSHWKLLNNIRNITDYQAKRFAKYLEKNKIEYITNLYKGEYVKTSDNDISEMRPTEVEDLINPHWYHNIYLNLETPIENVKNQILENQNTIHKAYEKVKQKATDSSVSFDMIREYVNKNYKANELTKLDLLINSDFSYKSFDQSIFENGDWDIKPQKFKGHEVFYEVVRTNNLMDIYKRIYSIIEIFNSIKYDKSITTEAIKFIV